MKKKILIVDDVKSMRELLRAQLEDASFEIIEAENARNFFEALKKWEFDLVLLDINLPDLSGITALHKIKKILPSRKPKVIFISGETDQSIVLSAIKAGGDGYICKPIDPMVFITKIQNVLKISKETNVTSVKCSLVYDYAKLPVISKDSIVEISETRCQLDTMEEFKQKGVFEISVPYLDSLAKKKLILNLKIDNVTKNKDKFLINCQFMSLSEATKNVIKSFARNQEAS
ncbi:response regulator [bacterium]|nr:response regulator [bacterium]